VTGLAVVMLAGGLRGSFAADKTEKAAPAEMVTAAGHPAGQDPLLPPNARAGECFARVFVPPEYNTGTKRVLLHEASEKVETVPARYEWVEEKVLVRDESEKLEVIPAKYKTVEEKVMVKPAEEKLVPVEAEYKTVEEKVLVRAGYTTWKKGRGPIQRVDNGTGEIMCLVEVPAEYKTIKKKILVTPAGVAKVEIPAEYKIVKKRALVDPARVEKIKVPAEYKTVKVQKQVEPAREVRTPIPAEYGEVTEVTKVGEGRMEWRPILCETNTTPGIITSLQKALLDSGFDPGPIDGALGYQTMVAVERFQQSKGLPAGQLTMETLYQLGVLQPKG
jgi:hypothetical protein